MCIYVQRIFIIFCSSSERKIIFDKRTGYSLLSIVQFVCWRYNLNVSIFREGDTRERSLQLWHSFAWSSYWKTHSSKPYFSLHSLLLLLVLLLLLLLFCNMMSSLFTFHISFHLFKCFYSFNLLFFLYGLNRGCTT